MPTIRIVVAPDPARMLALAVRGLFPLPASTTDQPWPTLDAWLVLRQGGLRDDMYALAAKHGVPGWFDSPVCLFAELAERWSGDGTQTLRTEERFVLLTELLSRHDREVFSRAGKQHSWLREIDRLIGELVGEGIHPVEFARAQKARKCRDRFETNRDAVLAAIYEDWHRTLVRANRIDGRDERVRLASFIERDPEKFGSHLRGRKDVRIVGLADLRGGWTKLITALAGSPVLERVTLLVSHEPDLPSELDTVVELDSAVSERHVLRTIVEAPDIVREAERVAVDVRRLIDAGAKPSRIAVVAREARPALDHIISALEIVGVPVTARERVAMASTAPVRALDMLLAGAANRWSLEALREVSDHKLLQLHINSGVFRALARSASIRSFDECILALTKLEIQCTERDASAAAAAAAAAQSTRANTFPVTSASSLPFKRQPDLPSTLDVATSITALLAFQQSVQWLDSQHSIREWLSWTIKLLTENNDLFLIPLRNGPDTGVEGSDLLDMQARTRTVQLAHGWSAALDAFAPQTASASLWDETDAAVDAQQFGARFATILNEDLIIQPTTSFGVVVAEVMAAGWREFDHLFITGLSSGNFPLRPTQSLLHRDHEVAELVHNGLPLDPPESWRGREHRLFRVLCEAPRKSLTLTWPATDAGGQVAIPSIFVDEIIGDAGHDDNRHAEQLHSKIELHRIPSHGVLTPGFPIIPALNADRIIEHARATALRELGRTRESSAHNGLIEDGNVLSSLVRRFGPDYVWSASSLESMAKCSWQWFAAKVLHLEEDRALDDSVEPMVSGRILHRALDLFFTSARERSGRPVFLLSTDRSWVEQSAIDSLDIAWQEESAHSWLGSQTLRTLVKAELLHQLLAYLRFEVSHNESASNNRTSASKQIRTGAWQSELAFDRVSIEFQNESLLLRGVIDRVDVGIDDRVDSPEQYIAAIDYKSSKESTPGGGSTRAWDDGIVLQIPLYAEVLKKLYANKSISRIEYRTLRRPEVVSALRLQFAKLAAITKRKTNGVLEADHEASRKQRAAIESAFNKVKVAREGTFATNPAPSCGCSPYCLAREICRIPGGPVESE